MGVLGGHGCQGGVTAYPASLPNSHYYRRLCLTGGGLAIMTRLASDAALERTAFLISHVTEAVDPRVLASMNSHGFRHAVMAAYPLELTTDIPEHAWLSPASYWDERARGLGECRQTLAHQWGSRAAREVSQCGGSLLKASHFKESILWAL